MRPLCSVWCAQESSQIKIATRWFWNRAKSQFSISSLGLWWTSSALCRWITLYSCFHRKLTWYNSCVPVTTAAVAATSAFKIITTIVNSIIFYWTETGLSNKVILNIVKLESVQLRKHCHSKATRLRASRSGVFFWVFCDLYADTCTNTWKVGLLPILLVAIRILRY